MGEHSKFKHKHVTGETNPTAIKKEMERIQAEEQTTRDKMTAERLNKK
jgi:hypothetical protein